MQVQLRSAVNVNGPTVIRTVKGETGKKETTKQSVLEENGICTFFVKINNDKHRATVFKIVIIFFLL